MPGKIHVPVTVATQGFTQLQNTFSRLKIATGALTVAFAGLAAASKAIDFTGAAIQGARDLERNYAGLESVFKDATGQMKNFGQTASEMGLSMNEAAKATTFIGSVLKQSGFSIAETANLTEELVELGADLALTYGYDVQEALLGMTALFRGEYDPIEKFGVAMKQSEIDAEKAARGLDGLTGAAERFADQQIRVEFLMERAGDAMGAFERQSGNLTVQQMRLRAEFENIRDTIADDLLPPLADFTGGIREIVEDVGPKLENTFDELAPVLENVSDEILKLISFGIDSLIAGVDSLVGFMQKATDGSTDLGASYNNLFDSVSNLATGMQEFLEPVIQFVEQYGPSFEEIVIVINTALAELLDFVERNKEVITLLAGAFALKAAKAALAATKIGLVNVALGTTVRLLSLTPFGAFVAGVSLLTIGIDLLGNKSNTAKEKLESLNDEMSETEKAEVYKDVLAEVEKEQGAMVLGGGKLASQIQELAEQMQRGEITTDEYRRKLKALTGNTDETDKSQTDLNLSFGEGTEKARELSEQEGLPSWYDSVKQKAQEATAAAYGFADATIQVLELELLDLMRFARFAPDDITEDINKIRDALIEMKRDRGDYLITDEDDGGDEAEDYVKNFFDGIAENVAKEAARLDLQNLGLSDALIEQILGASGWDEIFETIIDGGQKVADQLQDDFNKTAAGIQETAENAAELAKKLEKLAEKENELKLAITAKQDERDASIASAREQFDEFTESVDLTVTSLRTYQRQIGRFESQTQSDLANIENQINNAFDNGYLLMDARDNLLEYARAELNVLSQIQRQRDTLLGERNAAAQTIFGIAQAVTSAGQITQLLRGVQDEVKEVEVTELFEDIVESADSLSGFKVTLERNFTDVVTNTVNKSDALVSNFQNVIDRTRAFIDNLKLLRELGLDPFLFNQLVEAGAEAGGATAQALVEGGADTVNEVNSLQTELEAMGVELGEQTFDVTKNSGEQFVSGIVAGMDAELENLEASATNVANTFTDTFSMMFEAGMQTAFERITDTIKEEFRVMIDELNAELASIQDEQDRVAGVGAYFTPPAGTLFPGDPGYGNVIRSGMGETEILTPEQFRQQSSTTVVNNNYYGSEPLDLYKSSKQNVKQQSTFQGDNGAISATLSGVGN